MPIPTEVLVEYMRQAQEQPIGLVVNVTNPQRFLIDTNVKLRATSTFPDLMLCIPSTPDTVMIVHKSVELD